MLFIISAIDEGYRVLDTNTQMVRKISTRNIIRAIQSNNFKIENAEVKDESLVGTQGSLDRFITDTDKKPMVILFELVNSDGITEGYEVCDFIGRVKRLSIEDTIKAAKHLGIQNGKLSSRDEEYFISAIKGHYITKTIQPDTVEDVLRKEELEDWEKHGYSVEGMENYDHDQLEEIRMAYESEYYNIKQYITPQFTPEQIKEVRLGLQNGVDVSKYANHTIPALQMRLTRTQLETQNLANSKRARTLGIFDKWLKWKR